MISVIIPVYNTPALLHECLESVFEQTYKDIEVLVVDDGSKQPEKIKAVVDDFSVDVFIQQRNFGAPRARNLGFEASTGSYVLFLDADIVLEPQALEKLLAALKQSDADFSYCAYNFGWKKFPTIPFDPTKLTQYNYIHTSSLLRRDVFVGFDESLKRFQDWDLWLTIVANGGKGIGLTQVLFHITTTHGTMSSWLPKSIYNLPWPLFGYTPKAVGSYIAHRETIRAKHNLD